MSVQHDIYTEVSFLNFNLIHVNLRDSIPLAMASNNKTSPSGNMDDMTNLAKLLSKGHQDILSQAGRTLPNLQVLHDIIKTVLAGGIIDDRKYLVRDQNI
jgi:hypothetical protein